MIQENGHVWKDNDPDRQCELCKEPYGQYLDDKEHREDHPHQRGKGVRKSLKCKNAAIVQPKCKCGNNATLKVNENGRTWWSCQSCHNTYMRGSL